MRKICCQLESWALVLFKVRDFWLLFQAHWSAAAFPQKERIFLEFSFYTKARLPEKLLINCFSHEMCLTSITAKYRELNLIVFNGWVIIWRNEFAVSMVIFPRASVCNNLLQLASGRRPVKTRTQHSFFFLFNSTVHTAASYIPKNPFKVLSGLCHF